MNIESSRRGFIGGAAAFFVAGCKTGGWLAGKPRLRFGVVSDIHVTTQASCAMTEKAFRYFKSRGADAVMIPGDLTDWGLKSGFEYIKSVWDRVFSGTDVVPLFCTGNHDFEGWAYGDMTMEMHANGYSEDEALARIGLEEEWERIFGEKYAPFRVRTVKGYDFVSVEWDSFEKFPEWMEANGGRFKGGKPFFFFQHMPARGTTSDSGGWDDKGAAFAALKEFPNARNTVNRSGRWVIVMNCEFPSAVPPAGGRVFDYEIRIVPKDGSEPMAKKFLSPAYSRMAKYEPKGQRFWFDVAELPQDVDYVVEVRAFNCFGKESQPLVSGVWHSVPGLDKVKKEG